MHKPTTFVIIAALLAVAALAAGAQAVPPAGQAATLGGIGRMSNAAYDLQGSTLGQTAPGYSVSTQAGSGQAFALEAGFWYSDGAAQPPTPSGPRRLYLPLVARNYPPTPPTVELGEAPGQCPGYPVEPGTRYREDLDAANDNDWYRFTAQAGLTYTIRTFELGSRADTVVALYAPDCTTLLAENDDSGEPDDRGSLVTWRAPAAGEYHVMVRGYDWRVYGEGTGYSLLVTAQSGSLLEAGSSSLEAGSSSLETSNQQPSALHVEGSPATSAKPAPPPTPTPEGR